MFIGSVRGHILSRHVRENDGLQKQHLVRVNTSLNASRWDLLYIMHDKQVFLATHGWQCYMSFWASASNTHCCWQTSAPWHGCPAISCFWSLQHPGSRLCGVQLAYLTCRPAASSWMLRSPIPPRSRLRPSSLVRLSLLSFLLVVEGYSTNRHADFDDLLAVSVQQQNQQWRCIAGTIIDS